MSGQPSVPGDPETDLLAGEWVLGVLEGDARATAERRLQTDAAFRDAVSAWDRRLAPLAVNQVPVPPPDDLWARIEARTAAGALDSGAAAGPRAGNVVALASVRRWKLATAASLALAASLAAFIVVRETAIVPRPAAPMALAAVLAPTGSAPGFLALAAADGLDVRPIGPVNAADGRDLELWSLPEGAARPQSLGTLPVDGRHLSARLAPGTQVLVSLEARGGSPTGQPTGPVVYGGRLLTAR